MQRLHKILIANRGEIACRIARTCARLGLAAAGVHSSADRAARHVRVLGESVEIGPAPAAQSYLDINAVLAAARRVGADAVHPGYGFLSESAAFARAVEAAGLVFIGPTPETIERIGGKASAKREAQRLGLPVIEGSDSGLRDAQALAALVRTMPLPVLLKAVAGGGGRGMVLIETLQGLQARIESAMREAEASFGNPELLVERYLPQVRHIEVQIAGDGRGGAIHLFERECSLQRRHQKLIEEAPSAHLPAALRQALLDDACRLAAGAAYRGLGTVEFIVGAGVHHFLEVNPRLQVEHPVTEAITGLDLVELQLRIADEGCLPLTQAQVSCSGHAVEARLCAEDPASGFLPASGRIVHLRFAPPPLRVEQGVDSGDEVSPFYDSMIAKLIAHADTRAQALAQLQAGLRDTVLLGLANNRALLQQLLTLRQTQDCSFHTRLVDEQFGAGLQQPEPALAHLRAAALLWLQTQRHAGGPDQGCWSQWQGFTNWRLAGGAPGAAGAAVLRLRAAAHEWAVRFERPALQGPAHGAPAGIVVVIDGVPGNARLVPLGEQRFLLDDGDTVQELTLCIDGHHVHLASAQANHSIECRPGIGGAARRAAASAELLAPMLGKVVAIEAGVGDVVAAGQTVIVLESMKMELHVSAPYGAALQALGCALGDMVERGAVLACLAPAPAPGPAAAPASSPAPV